MTPTVRLIDAMMADETLLDRLIGYDSKIKSFRKVLNDERVAHELQLTDLASMFDMAEPDLLAIANGGRFSRGEGPAGAASREPEPADEAGRGPVRRHLDLRPLFEAGREPLADILEAVAGIGPGEALVIEAPFHPLPLRRLLGRRGFRSAAQYLGADHWQVRFERIAPGATPKRAERPFKGCGGGGGA